MLWFSLHTSICTETSLMLIFKLTFFLYTSQHCSPFHCMIIYNFKAHSNSSPFALVLLDFPQTSVAANLFLISPCDLFNVVWTITAFCLSPRQNSVILKENINVRVRNNILLLNANGHVSKDNLLHIYV